MIRLTGIILMVLLPGTGNLKAQLNQSSTSDKTVNHVATAIILPIQTIWAGDIAEIDESCWCVSAKNFGPIYVSNDSFTKVDAGEIVGQQW
ncbi:MAG: hypothetical protein ABIN67_18415 [Ferruginibacter sp.]